MPLTKKGQKIMRSMKEQYGPERGEEVFYASRNKGAIKGVEKFARGGSVAKKSFPDLNKDGKVTKADVLKGRGVKGFEKGGAVRGARVPMEPDEETMKKIEAEQAEKGVSKTQTKIEDKASGRVTRRGDDREVIKKARGGMVGFAEGGMVRGCKSVQTSGKGFKGTF